MSDKDWEESCNAVWEALLRKYERYKRKLRKLNITSEEYEQAIQRIADYLGV